MDIGRDAVKQMLDVALLQPTATPSLTANSTAFLFTVGSAPGRPRHTGQTCVFAAAPKAVPHAQNIFEPVFS